MEVIVVVLAGNGRNLYRIYVGLFVLKKIASKASAYYFSEQTRLAYFWCVLKYHVTIGPSYIFRIKSNTFWRF